MNLIATGSTTPRCLSELYIIGHVPGATDGGGTAGSFDEHPAVHVVVDCRSLLGEGVTWDDATGELLWVDIDGHLLHRLDPTGRHTATPIGRRVSVVVPRAAGGYVAVAGREIVHLDRHGVFGDVVATLPTAGDGEANDGRVDPRGRLWVGSVDRSGLHRGALFCVDEFGVVTEVLGGRALSNGIDWSPDGLHCFYADSLLRRIDLIELDHEGLPADVHEFRRFTEMPDGLTVDAAGFVWVALWDGGGIRRLDTNGKIDRAVPVAGGWITSCAFGGADLRTLYITTATVDLDDDARSRAPHAGSLFGTPSGVAGRGYTPFGADSP